MKAKNSKQVKQSRPTIRVKDLKPQKDVKGGITSRKAGEGQKEF
jgi:hypothetical protein